MRLFPHSPFSAISPRPPTVLTPILTGAPTRYICSHPTLDRLHRLHLHLSRCSPSPGKTWNHTGSFTSISRPQHYQFTQLHNQDQHQHNHGHGYRYSPYHHYISIAVYLAPVYVTVACLTFVYYESTFHLELLQPEEEFETMEVPPGRPGNLTPEQDASLRQLWAAIFKLCNVVSAEELAAAMEKASLSPPVVVAQATLGPESAEKDKPKKKRLGFFSRSKNTSSKDVSSTSAEESQIISPTPGESAKGGAAPDGRVTPLPPGTEIDDKYGQTKHFLETLETQTPESIRSAIWSMVKHDHPDALVLRFLRARKWDVDKALVMLISTMNWRHEQMKVDEVIMKEGELVPSELENAEDTAAATRTLARDFLAQMRMGKSFIHGVDRHGRPICVVRVRYHRAGEQCEESLERYTVYLIETARMLLASPVDTATVVFDMTNFSVANMDYTPVKFMIKCFEANYPESLGAVLVHKAPWVFQGIWKIIRSWLDPVVAAKVHFTNNAKDIEEFIPAEHILKELDGQEQFEYSYIEPVAGENDMMKDVATRDRLLERRGETVREYEQLTLKWIGSPEDEALRRRRTEVAEKLRVGYWELDPYLRAKSLYDRFGVLQNGGKVVPYPGEEAGGAKKSIEEKQKGVEVAVVTGGIAVKADADDVD